MTRYDSPLLLLGGFGSFPNAPFNPSERLIRQIRKQPPAFRGAIATMILPVEWERSWVQLEAEIGRLRPDAVLLFGLHAGAERLRLELTGANERRMDMPDAAGRFASSGTICAGASAAEVSLPLEAIRRRFEATGIEHELSRDAGRYLCNETLFLLCSSAAALGVRRYGFVHTPLTDECAAEMKAAGVEAQTGYGIEAVRLRQAAEIVIACLEDDLQLAS